MTAPVVAAPVLTFEDAGGGAAALERPVTILFGPVAPAGPAGTQPAVAGFHVLRQAAGPEVWDDAAKAWVADDPAVAAMPLAFRDGEPLPWMGLLVAAAVTDAAGAPAYARGRSYRIRGCFDRVIGPAGPELRFVGAADRNRVLIGPGEQEKPESATQVRLLLTDDALRVIGGLTVRRSGAAAEVTLSNAAGAVVALRDDGSIELRPAPGRGVLVAADLEVGHLTYLPAGGATKRTLS